MGIIAENISALRTSIPEGIQLVAVSKTHPVEAIIEAYSAGQRIFGENRPQEMAAKHLALASLSSQPRLHNTTHGIGLSPDTSDHLASLSDHPNGSHATSDPSAIHWHQIGHLQTNKVRLIAPFVELIHSADSARLLREISKQAILNHRRIDVLLELRIAREQSKEGWDWLELTEWLSTGEWRELSGVRFRGVMGVATNTDDLDVVREEFLRLAAYHSELLDRFFGVAELDPTSNAHPASTAPTTTPAPGDFDTLSMGMSDDYPVAIECGSTMVRIGSRIFGARDYK